MATAAPDLLQALDDLGRRSGRLRIIWTDYATLFLATYAENEVVGRERLGRDFASALEQWDSERWAEVGINYFSYLSPRERLEHVPIAELIAGRR